MINLLPDTYKERLDKDRKQRTILNLGIFLLAFLIIFGMMLLTVKIIFESFSEQQAILFQTEEKVLKLEKDLALEKGIEDLDREAKAADIDLAEISKFYKNSSDLVSLIGKINGFLASGSYLTSFIYEKESLKVSVAGFAPDRDTLFLIKENFEKEPEFSDLFFPSTNWLDPGRFNLTFKITSNEKK